MRNTYSDSDARSIRSVAVSERSVKTFSSAAANPFDDDDDDDGGGSVNMSTSGGHGSGTGNAAHVAAASDDPKKPKLCTIRLGAGYSPEASLLRVNVLEVADLAWKEDSKPDLYVKMFLAPDPKKTTKVRAVGPYAPRNTHANFER